MNGQPNRKPQTVNREPSFAGFTLIEVTIATSLLVVIALGSAQLFVLAIRQTVAARQQLVLTLVEFLRKLMERQAIRRMKEKTLTPKQIEAVGTGLMKLEETIREIGKRFGLTPEDLNLDLGTLKLM